MAPDSLEHNPEGFIEYVAGDLNVILAAPHGGSLQPSTIPDRNCGYYIDGQLVYRHDVSTSSYENCPVRNKKDVYTRELALMVSSELHKVTGKWPHLVINHLHRLKMDGNSEKDRATFGIPKAEDAWELFHCFVNTAKQSVAGSGLFIDLHGHSHPEKLIELGYTIPAENLNRASFGYQESSIRNLAMVNKLTKSEEFADLIQGHSSFGGLLEAKGYRVVPSPSFPSPKSRPYYSGGYNTHTHGSRNGGVIDSLQIETPRYLRNKETAPEFAKHLADVINQYLNLYY